MSACLAAYGGQYRVRTFARDDRLEILQRQRLNVSAMGELGVGHDGGGIRVHQHHFVSFGTQRFASLGARIVEFAGLADDDGAGADNQDFFEVRAFWHLVTAPGRTRDDVSMTSISLAAAPFRASFIRLMKL